MGSLAVVVKYESENNIDWGKLDIELRTNQTFTNKLSCGDLSIMKNANNFNIFVKTEFITNDINKLLKEKNCNE